MSARRLPRLAEQHHDGEVTPAAFDDELLTSPPIEPRWLALGCALCALSAVFVGLGVWKAIELIGHAT